MESMRKKIYFLLLFFSIFSSLSADEYLAEVKVGYFRPSNNLFRDLFPDGWPNYQIELSYSPFARTCKDWWRGFFGWASVNYLHAAGNTIARIDDCSICIIPAAIGLKYLYPIPCDAQIYAGMGLKYFWLRVDNKDPEIHFKDRARGLGGVFSIGALFHPIRNVFVDLFVDYSLKHFDKRHFSQKENNVIPSDVNISGLTLGIGAGLWF